jgi:Zn-dependent peptidase ImmA (M78 family)
VAIRRRKIQMTAEGLLAQHHVLAPPVPIKQIAKACGARIFYQALEGDLSGFLYRENGQAVIGVNTHHAGTRQLFTIAHELGHLLLHACESVHVDHSFRLQMRNHVSSEGTSDQEIEANLFAAELLMPEAFLRQDLARESALSWHGDEFLATLARRYGVSLQALMIRLSRLGYIQE